MSTRGFHQILPNLTPDDAVGEQALLLDRVLREWGWISTIHAEHSTLPQVSRPLRKFPRSLPPGHILLYHHSIGCDAAETFLRCQATTRLVWHHNITPPVLLAGVPDVAARATRGLQQLPILARHATAGLADSAFNCRDLVEAGFARTATVALALAPEREAGLRQAAAVAAARQRDPERPVFLNVGRLLPHKNLEAALAVFELYRQRHPQSRPCFRIVGHAGETPEYGEFLRSLIRERNIAGVEFTGLIPRERLFDEFAAADAYLHMSQHEGFGMTLVECLFAGLPIVAARAGALGETVAGAGLVFEPHEWNEMAEALHTLVHQPDARDAVLRAQTARAGEFTIAAFARRLAEALRTLADCPDSLLEPAQLT